jgi:putative ABC transport system permease protein
MRLYRALQHLYPASFRREYGDEMTAVFDRKARSASTLPATLALWAETIADIVITAGRLHLDLLIQDAHYAVRTLGRSPGFAVTAIGVTALGIGATTAAFSVTSFVFLRPLPYADPDRLVTIWHRAQEYRMELSPPNYRDWKAQQQSFVAMGAYHGLETNFVAKGEPERLSGAAVTADLLPVLGVQPATGRLFTRDEEEHESGGRIILSHGLWERAFGSDRGVIGRAVLLDGTPHVIVGIMPATFSFPTRESAFWTLMSAADRLNDERDNYWFHALGRLKPGVTLEQARADLSVIAARLEKAYPDVNQKVGATAYLLRDEYSDRSRALLTALCGASLSVLLIACANLANLLIARSHARRRELELRAALGAGRERLVRQLLTESLLVALAGGVAGVLIAIATVPVLSRLIPATMPIPAAPSVDLQALAVAAVLTLLTGVGFGVVPAIRSSATASFDALREGSRGGVRGLRLRSMLVAVEVAASVALLVWAGLLLRALDHIDRTDPGFRPESVLTARTALPRPKYTLAIRRQAYFTQVLEQLRALPGVSHAGFVSFLPMTMGGGIFPVALHGEQAQISGRVASLRFATPDYFAAMGIPLRRGRDIRETDDLRAPMVAVVSQSFVDQHMPGTDPIGQQFNIAYEDRTIVGVVGDVRVRGPERIAEPQVYLPYRQVDDESFPFFTPKDLAIRSTMAPGALVPELRRIVRAADPEQPVSNIETMGAIITKQTESRTVQVRVLVAFAGVALILAAIGIHGLLAFSVSQRRHEIGVRMALGAEPSRIARGIVGQSALLGLAGVLPGAALGYAGGRMMESLLLGIAPTDALTFGAAALLCSATTLVGSLIPAVRAVQVPPADVFRAE